MFLISHSAELRDKMVTTEDVLGYWRRMFTRIYTKDGASVSVQASSSHYSTPRVDTPETPYTHVELGFFENCEHPSYMKEYADSWDDTPADVYAYVPTELVDRWIQEHGGIDIGRTITAHHNARAKR